MISKLFGKGLPPWALYYCSQVATVWKMVRPSKNQDSRGIIYLVSRCEWRPLMPKQWGFTVRINGRLFGEEH